MAKEDPQIQNQVTTWLLRRTPNGGVRRVAPLAAAVASEIGCVRSENQDRAIIVRGRDAEGQNYAIFAVADGIGGMKNGAECAALTLGAFVAGLTQGAKYVIYDSATWIRNAAIRADQAVYSEYRGNGGSTLVALILRPGEPARWLSVGDSRVYSSSDKKLTQVSVDDTIAGQLGKGFRGNTDQTRLLQYIGMGSELEPHIAKIDHSAETVLLTTDGVHFLSTAPEWLSQIINNSPDPGICVKRLVDLAKWCGGPDNATVAMISLVSDWENEERPPYACIEIWDSFGELQLIPVQPQPSFFDGNAQANRDFRLLKEFARRKVPDVGQPEVPDHNNEKQESPESDLDSNPRRNKASPRKKAKKSDKNLSEEEQQLKITFPFKPN
jgi:serine/threonine protein phosphatase PrpC